jgi:hypothetical protein
VIAVITMIVIAVALAACMLVLVVRGGISLATRHTEEERMQAIHLPALLNLLDESQQDYLRSRLPKKDFGRLQRQRNRALLVYVKRIASNSAVLMRYAHAATLMSDPEMVAAGRELMQSSLNTRISALKALGLLYVGLVMPTPVKNLAEAISRYSSATDRFSEMGRRTRHSTVA